MKTIVIVDDFKTNAVILKSTMQCMGFNVLEAYNPSAALRFFDGRSIDLLITDFRMPEMSGAELTKKVKSIQAYRNMPVLILSSETSEEHKREAREAGAYGWLAKPFNIDRYMKIVNSVIK
jgi:two-component system, chemotaxis family, chemotaxis protein CheY